MAATDGRHAQRAVVEACAGVAVLAAVTLASNQALTKGLVSRDPGHAGLRMSVLRGRSLLPDFYNDDPSRHAPLAWPQANEHLRIRATSLKNLRLAYDPRTNLKIFWYTPGKSLFYVSDQKTFATLKDRWLRETLDHPLTYLRVRYVSRAPVLRASQRFYYFEPTAAAPFDDNVVLGSLFSNGPIFFFPVISRWPGCSPSGAAMPSSARCSRPACSNALPLAFVAPSADRTLSLLALDLLLARCRAACLPNGVDAASPHGDFAHLMLREGGALRTRVLDEKDEGWP